MVKTFERPYESLDGNRRNDTSTTYTAREQSAALTDTGRVFCDQLAGQVLERCSSSPTSTACEIWETAAPSAGLRWSVCSGSRLIGGLPAVDRTGTPLVEGPHEYVFKLELGTQQVPISRYGNCCEALIWQQSREREVEQLFAPVVAHASDYQWLVMEETAAIGHDTWGGHGTPPRATRQQCDSFDDRLTEYEQALAQAGLEFGASYDGQVGIDRCDRLVVLDYEHLHDVTARTDPVWAGTYDPSHQTFISATEACERNSRMRFHVLRWLANCW